MISPHGIDELREDLIKQYKAQYWIGCDSQLQTLISFVVPNVVAEFPMTYLIDARGKIVDFGKDLEGKIEYLLDEVFDPKLGRDLHAELRSARKSWEAGAIGAAWVAAGRKLEAADAKVVADATFVREQCEACAVWKRRLVEREIASGALASAARRLKKVERAFQGMAIATWAATTRTELEKDPKVKMESVLGAPFDATLDRHLHAELKSAGSTYEKGRIGTAWKAAGQHLEAEDSELVDDARFLRERCEDFAEWHRYAAQRDIDKHAYPTAVLALKKLAKACKGMPAGDWAAERARELGRDPKVRIEIKAWARLERALARAEKAAGNPKKLQALRKEYNAIRLAYPDTAAAKEAIRLLKQ